MRRGVMKCSKCNGRRGHLREGILMRGTRAASEFLFHSRSPRPGPPPCRALCEARTVKHALSDNRRAESVSAQCLCAD